MLTNQQKENFETIIKWAEDYILQNNPIQLTAAFLDEF
jgi:hypothetical protein